MSLSIGLSLALGGQRGGGGAAFNPASMFAGGKAGVFYDTANLASLFQDRSMTPSTPAVVDGPVGTHKDLSGNGNHRIASSDNRRPTLRNSGQIYWLEYDGADDRLTCSATIAGVGANGAMFAGCSIPNSATSVNVFNDASRFTMVTESGAVNSPATNSGSPTFSVDGVAISPNTRGALFTAAASASGVTPHLVESRNTDCSGYTTLTLGSGVALGIIRDYGFLAISETDLGTNGAALRAWFGQRMGLSL